jgi:hypothetical protein
VRRQRDGRPRPPDPIEGGRGRVGPSSGVAGSEPAGQLLRDRGRGHSPPASTSGLANAAGSGTTSAPASLGETLRVYGDFDVVPALLE